MGESLRFKRDYDFSQLAQTGRLIFKTSLECPAGRIENATPLLPIHAGALRAALMAAGFEADLHGAFDTAPWHENAGATVALAHRCNA
jgi:hypothetical protein